MLSALLLGAMRAGAPLMQIQARVPVEIIDVIQGVILIFLAATLARSCMRSTRSISAIHSAAFSRLRRRCRAFQWCQSHGHVALDWPADDAPIGAR
jgi:ABC-type uncharacterized transport system permease subunit